MKLTRRNALIGMGTVAAGAGVIGGTGAFTSVEAERTVSVQTAGDSDAALDLAAAPSSDNASEYVTTSNGQIQLNLDGTSDNGNENGASSTGLNQDAKTTINNLIQVTNNGSQGLTSLRLSLESDSANIDETVAFKFTTGANASSPHNNNPSSPVDVSGGGLSQGSSLVFGMIINLIPDDATTFDPNKLPSGTSYTLTIEANTS